MNNDVDKLLESPEKPLVIPCTEKLKSQLCILNDFWYILIVRILNTVFKILYTT